MPSSLRAMVRRFQLRLIARQLTLTKLLIKDTTSNAGEADELIAEAEAKERDSGRQWLYTTVGHALSSWAIIEENLVVIATLLLRLSPSEAGLILYSIINFNTWLSIIGELFKMEEGYEKLIPEWNRFSNRLRRLKTIRDNLAHQTVVYQRHKGDVTLRPAPFDARLQSQRHKPLDIDQMFKYQDDLHTMISALTSFISTMTPIVAARASQQKSPE